MALQDILNAGKRFERVDVLRVVAEELPDELGAMCAERWLTFPRSSSSLIHLWQGDGTKLLG